VRLWSQKVGADVALKFRSRRRGKCGKKWHMDLTYLKIKGYDVYLYRAIDKEAAIPGECLKNRDFSDLRRG